MLFQPNEGTKIGLEPMNKINKKILIVSSLLGAITIAIGAFGAHGLKSLVDEESLRTFETGVRYQMYHVLALLAFSFSKHLPAKALLLVFRFFLLGILFFSGSIYFLALQEVLPFSVRFLGPITPLGGLLFIMGWLYLAYSVYKQKD